MTDHWVLDVTMEPTDDGPFAFCPMTEDEGIMVGLTLVTDRPPGPLVGVFHNGGQEAVGKWCDEHPELMADLFPFDPDAF